MTTTRWDDDRDVEALGRDNRGLQLEVRRLVEELRQGRSGQQGSDTIE